MLRTSCPINFGPVKYSFEQVESNNMILESYTKAVSVIVFSIANIRSSPMFLRSFEGKQFEINVI